ncbi:MAG: nuclear transport factor 2 family protein [Bacteroidota bacterium]
MKKIALTLAFVGCFVFTTTAQQVSDFSLVEKTLNYYLQGGTNNDFETLKKAFHESATMKYIGKDGYTEVNAIDFFQKGMKSGGKQDRKTRIEYLNISGHAAHAKLIIDYPTFSFIDYMNLLKVDGEWKIVSKIFYRK